MLPSDPPAPGLSRRSEAPAKLGSEVDSTQSEPDAKNSRALSRLARSAMAVLWPAFLMACVLEMLTFAVVDPAELQWFGGAAIGWPAAAVYTVTFLIFWWAIASAGAMSLLLMSEPDAVDRRPFADAQADPDPDADADADADLNADPDATHRSPR